MYARLVSLRGNLPQTERVDQKYVNEFHSILGELESDSGADLTTCRVPPAELVRVPVGDDPIFNNDGDIVGYKPILDDAITCERNYVTMKIDSLLEFFSVRDRQIGFRAS
jgi:hypothetical protein